MVKTDLKQGCPKHYRPNTADYYIVRELKNYDNYNVYSNDLLLDVGAHIGIVSNYFLKRGIWRTICVEANKENYELLKLNMQPWFEKAPIFYNRAVTVENEGDSFLFLSKRNTGGHTIRKVNGRDFYSVPNIGIDFLLQKYKPTILKIDIEGAELDLVKAFDSGNLSFVRIMFCELHWFNKDLHKKCKEFLTIMESLGFTCLTDFEDFPVKPFRNAKMGVWVNTNVRGDL